MIACGLKLRLLVLLEIRDAEDTGGLVETIEDVAEADKDTAQAGADFFGVVQTLPGLLVPLVLRRLLEVSRLPGELADPSGLQKVCEVAGDSVPVSFQHCYISSWRPAPSKHSLV